MTESVQEQIPVSGGPHAPEHDLLFRKRKKKGRFSVALPEAPLPNVPLADTHAHLGAINAPLALARAAFWGFDFICCITEPDHDAPRVYRELGAWQHAAARLLPALIEATDKVLATRDDPASQAMQRLLADRPAQDCRIPQVRVAIGCHPHTARRWNDDLLALERQALVDPRTCAVGEIGLDYYYDLSPRPIQQQVFRTQLRLAKEAGLPVFLHVRDAHDDALAILQEEGFPQAGTILHCCSLPPDKLAPWIAAGCYIAYGGILTFGTQDVAREGARTVPHDRLLLETDSPYMAPHPLRGNQCYPDFSLWTALRLCEICGQDAPGDKEAFLETLHANALGLQNRPPTAWQQAHASLAGPLPSLYPEEGSEEDDGTAGTEECI